MDKTDRLYILKLSFDLNNIFTEHDRFNVFDDILGILDSRNNYKRAQYHTNEEKLRLLLRTNAQYAPVLTSGHGFRALAFASGRLSYESSDTLLIPILFRVFFFAFIFFISHKQEMCISAKTCIGCFQYDPEKQLKQCFLTYQTEFTVF